MRRGFNSIRSCSGSLVRPSWNPLLPVLQPKRRDARELARIVRHQRQVVPKGHSGDLQIVRSDRCSLPFKRTTDLGAFHCARVIEWERGEGGEKRVQLRVFTWWIGLDSAP